MVEVSISEGSPLQSSELKERETAPGGHVSRVHDPYTIDMTHMNAINRMAIFIIGKRLN
jgi:hypothetical protein